ncbi:MAG TPA: cytochrome oxidase small assembly protein [Steroidobacteraceae bacterium]
MDRNVKAANRKTGFILLSIALVFFVGAFAARMLGTPAVSIAVLGGAMILFLVLAIGRHLRR